jgi:hypothetical protein
MDVPKISPAILDAIHDTWLGETIRDSAFLFPTLEAVHFFGLCLLLGAMLLVDLRLVGFVRGPARPMLTFTRLAIAGFAINLLSGIGFFVSNPANYAGNPLFWIKMGLVLLAGLNVAWFELIERGRILALPEGADTPKRAKLVGALSLALWFSVIVLGRFLPVLGVG